MRWIEISIPVFYERKERLATVNNKRVRLVRFWKTNLSYQKLSVTI